MLLSQRSLGNVCLFFATVFLPSLVQADHHKWWPLVHGCSCQEMVCPRCHCRATLEEVKKENTCFKVECKAICVPKVRLPWQKLCTPKCAKVKYVHVMRKAKYECKSCKKKFTPVCCEPCGCCNRIDTATTDSLKSVPRFPPLAER